MFAVPKFQIGNNADNYVANPANSLLSPINGTSLSLFGMQLDLADYMAPDNNGEMDEISRRVFMDFVLRQDQATKIGRNADLPRDLSECETYATWYLGIVNSWLPVLHKPTFINLVSFLCKCFFNSR